ncbi:putative adenylate cyclase [Nostocoides japonicum T1-X7]|uniref:Putative adenylate cyclase n=1 Tax=Nostocoides japonicum T1-X7 TaxID=1194083 RepID=A0A077LY41_9MICO|nr:AAA family ATPase [Tetrasphaera japonica]CCH76894.1 putative adenylate cyclase [Tetrasphaera japonica T1-X7]
MRPRDAATPAAPARITLLGATDVRRQDAGPVALSARALALIALLAARAGVAQHRSHLAGLLWPDSTDAQARTNLRREVHLVRAALGEDCGLVVDGALLAWVPTDRCLVDVTTFRAARDGALAGIARGDTAQVEACGRAALVAYQGPFLPTVHDEWVLEERERLRRDCLDLFARVGAYWLDHGDPERGLPYARARVRLAPLEEPGYVALMALQCAIGDRAGAVTTFHEAASALEQELGVAPGPELHDALDAALADTGRGPNAGDDGTRTALARPASVPLVGRHRELATLRAAWADARHRSRFVLVTGDPGVGKSRLVAELAGEVRRHEGVVASARCYAASGSLPLAPVAEWLRTPQLRQSVRRLDPVWRAEAERVAPVGSADPDPSSSARAKVDAWQRHRFFEGLARAVAEVGRPLLLTVDDLQWCDRATPAWLSFLLSFPVDIPLLVVATARRDELLAGPLAEPLRAMRAAGQLEVLRLDTLSREATHELATCVLGRAVEDAEIELLHSVTSGSPFYVVEGLRESMSTPHPLDPTDFAQVVELRLSRLPGPARDIARLAAAVGRDFTLDLVTEAADLPEDEVVRAVDLLWRLHVLTQEGFRYRFSHELLRSAVYADTSPPQRWLLHRRLAQALQLLHSPEDFSAAAQIAEQYAAGGAPDRAVPFFARAARQASVVFAHGEAVRLWDRALHALETLPPHRGRDEQELELLLAKIPPLGAYRGYTAPGMERTGRRVADLGARLGQPDDHVTGLIAQFSTTFVQGRIEESLRLGRASFAGAAAAPGLAAQGHMAVAGSLLSLGRVDEADHEFASACELAGETDSLPIGTRTAVHARAWWAHALWLSGRSDVAWETATQAVTTAREIGHPYTLAVALSYAAVTAWMDSADDRLREVHEELSELCNRYRFAYYSEWATVLGGWLHGGPAGADEIRSGIDALVAQRSLTRMPLWLDVLARTQVGAGDADAARGTLDAARTRAASTGDVWWLPEVLRDRAALSDPTTGQRLLSEGIRLASAHGSRALVERCEGDLAEARSTAAP